MHSCYVSYMWDGLYYTYKKKNIKKTLIFYSVVKIQKLCVVCKQCKNPVQIFNYFEISRDFVSGFIYWLAETLHIYAFIHLKMRKYIKIKITLLQRRGRVHLVPSTPPSQPNNIQLKFFWFLTFLLEWKLR